MNEVFVYYSLKMSNNSTLKRQVERLKQVNGMITLNSFADKHPVTGTPVCKMDITFNGKRYTSRAVGFNMNEMIGYRDIGVVGHNIRIHSITLQPGTDCILKDSNAFWKTFKIHNGTDIPQTFPFNWYHPRIYSLEIKPGEKDGKSYDSYNWLWYIVNREILPIIAIVLLFIILGIVAAVSGKKGSSNDTTPPPVEDDNT